MNTYKTIIWEEIDQIGHLILNQPPSNQMTKPFFDELKHLTQQIIPQSSVKAIVMYGAGRHFSSGVEMNDLFNEIDSQIIKKESFDSPLFLEENILSFCFFDELKIPVVAAIQGVCLGSALELAMFCHVRIVAENSLLALPESTFSLMPGCGGTQKLPHLTSFAKSIELILTGENFSAQQASEYGIADIVIPKKMLIEQAIAFAKFIANNYKRILMKKYIKDFFNE